MVFAGVEVMIETVILAIPFAMLWASHYVPWYVVRSFVGADRQLRRPLAYAWGCGWILATMVVWAIMMQDGLVSAWIAVRFLALVMASAGAGTLLPRLLETLAEKAALEDDRRDGPADQG